jgi:Ca2+-binding EF-hand superfamily protein
MKAFFILAILILLNAGIAYGGDDMPDKLDTNRDGKIDLQEFTNGVSRTFQLYDKNGDGHLDLNELSASQAADPKKWFNEIDTNKDGRIDYPEFLEAATKWFKASDTDRDGYLTRTELNAARSSSSSGLFIRFRF